MCPSAEVLLSQFETALGTMIALSEYMNLKFQILFVTALLCALPVKAQDRCSSIFGITKNLGEFGENASLMSSNYIAMFRTHRQVSGNLKSGVLTQDIYRSSSLQYATIITRFKPQARIHTNDPYFLQIVKENFDFVDNDYSQRRDFTTELREKLRQEAIAYAEQSTYVEVRKLNPDNYNPEELLGTMKIVGVDGASAIKKLPMENDFSIQVPSNAGRKFEPSNFVVSKNQPKIIKAESYTQLILHARAQLLNPQHEPHKLMYFTPADRLGVKMYGKLGFVPVPGYESPLKEEEAGVSKGNEKDWWMIGSTAENLANLPKRFAENKSLWSPEDIDWINELIARFEKLSGTKTESEGHITRDISGRALNRVQEIGLFITEPLSLNNQNYRRLDIQSINGGNLEISILIPESDYPLKNGWRLKRGHVEYEYSNGVLKITDPILELFVSLEIDPKLRQGQTLKLRDRFHDLKAMW